MPRSIWKGDISFGLININVELFTATSPNKVPFHLADKRDGSSIKYLRISEETGKEVPWDQITKSYEYQKNNFMLLDKDKLKEFSPELTKTIDLEEFVHLSDLSVLLFDKPYYLVPSQRSKKSYVLLRETLKQQDKCGIGKVVIRTKQHLAAIFPVENALILNLMYFPEEIKPMSDFAFPENSEVDDKIKSREIKLSSQLVESMTTVWDPQAHRDDYSQNLRDWLEKELSGKGKSKRKVLSKKKKDNIINIEELLQKS